MEQLCLHENDFIYQGTTLLAVYNTSVDTELLTTAEGSKV
jgi:hypothetical protein